MRKIVEEILETKFLESLHEQKHYDLFTMENNSDTIWHKKFYDSLRSDRADFVEAYDSFVKNEVTKVYKGGCSFIYQKWPTLRINVPGNRCLPEAHCDSQEGYNHPDGEINFQIAITDIFDTNATWIESVPGLRDFSPINLRQNEFAVFNGNKCIHKNELNLTGKTRISFDFRILPLDRYKPDSQKVSNTKKTKFVVGDYYKSCGW